MTVCQPLKSNIALLFSQIREKNLPILFSVRLERYINFCENKNKSDIQKMKKYYGTPIDNYRKVHYCCHSSPFCVNVNNMKLKVHRAEYYPAQDMLLAIQNCKLPTEYQ